MLRFSFTVLIAALISQSVYARSFSAATGGNASFDFNRGELRIPCLSVQGSDSDDDYFSVMLQQRGNSMNFEVTLVEPDDKDECGKINILANSVRSSEPELHLECQVSENRIRIEVEGEDLLDGVYTATVNSSSGSISEDQESLGQEVKFDFDSDDPVDALGTDFAVEGEEITAKLTSGSGEALTLETNATCRSATQDQDEDSDEDSTDTDMDDDTVGDPTESEDGEDDADDDQGDTDDDTDVNDDDGIETVTEATVNPGRGNSGNNPGQSGQDNGKSNADKKNDNGKSNKN